MEKRYDDILNEVIADVEDVVEKIFGGKPEIYSKDDGICSDYNKKHGILCRRCFLHYPVERSTYDQQRSMLAYNKLISTNFIYKYGINVSIFSNANEIDITVGYNSVPIISSFTYRHLGDRCGLE